MSTHLEAKIKRDLTKNDFEIVETIPNLTEMFWNRFQNEFRMPKKPCATIETMSACGRIHNGVHSQ